MTARPNSAARAPSTTRWSNVTAIVPIVLDDDLAVADDGPLRDPADAEDRHFRIVDDRGVEEPGELAGARHRERRAPQVLGGELAGAGLLGEPREVGGELVDGPRVAAADDGDDEPLVGLDGDTEVVPVEVDDLVALEPRVQLGEALQLLGDGLQHGRDRAARGRGR